jgi:hypothetical protein
MPKILSYLRNACVLNVAIQYLAILKYVYTCTRTIYSKMKSVSHHPVDLLYKSTVHNSFVSYCLLNMTWTSAFIAPNQYHKKIYNTFQIISEYYESS